MAQFKDREEYERWKAERSRQLAEEAARQNRPPEKKQPERETAVSGNIKGIGELFGQTWDVYKDRFGILISLCLLMILLFILPLAVFGGSGFALTLVLPDLKVVLIGTFMTVGAVISIVTLFWGMSALLCAVTDESLTIKEALAAGWPKVGGLIWLLTVLGFLTTGGFLLLFIPGVIFTVWFVFGQFIFIEDDERGLRALLKSKEFVKGYGFEVFIRLFLIWLVSVVLGIVPFMGPILALLFVPFTIIYLYLIYEDLKTIKGNAAFVATAGEKMKWLGTAALGYVLVPVIMLALMGAFLSVPLLSLNNMMSSVMKDAAVRLPGMVMNKDVEEAYYDYRTAFTSGDIERLKTLVVREKANELEGEQARAILEMAKAFSPKQVTISGITVTDDTATITAAGENRMTGTIQMRKEEGVWKLVNESWSMSMNAAGPPSRPDARRPYEYARITGAWKGHEAGKADDDWELTLGPAFDVAATGSGGEYYHGDSIVDDSLGVEGNSIRVLPGGAPFDLRIAAASNPSYIGKISLGSYKLMGEVLQMCGGEPGLMKRTSDFRSGGGIRCFEFRRVSGPIESPPSGNAAKIQPPQPSPQSGGGSSFSKQDPGISGQAIVVIDGKTEVYPLSSGFSSDTRLENPSRGSVQFQAPAPGRSNARRIEITLDATRTGSHYAEGSLLSDNFMSSDKIQIGQPTANGFTASFRWVADGGQIYFPKPSCTVMITSAYSGTASGVFSGEVRNCTVHSAGIDHHISSVQFSVKGVSAR